MNFSSCLLRTVPGNGSSSCASAPFETVTIPPVQRVKGSIPTWTPVVTWKFTRYAPRRTGAVVKHQSTGKQGSLGVGVKTTSQQNVKATRVPQGHFSRCISPGLSILASETADHSLPCWNTVCPGLPWSHTLLVFLHSLALRSDFLRGTLGRLLTYISLPDPLILSASSLSHKSINLETKQKNKEMAWEGFLTGIY